MTVLPIVHRELSISARRGITYWSRAVVAFVGICLGGFVVHAYKEDHPALLGPALFHSLAWVTVVYCLFIGVLLTSDCLSEEKRDGTLGLLFLTDLTSYDVVFGKLAAKSLTAVFGLLAIFPILAFSFPLGGITADEFWRVCLVALNAMFFSLAIGMFSSAVCRDERRATLLTFAIILTVTALAPWMSSGSVSWRRLLLYISPGFSLNSAFEANYLINPMLHWSSMAMLQVFSWTGLLVAMRVVPNSWQEKSAAGRNQSRSVSDQVFRKRLLDSNPYFWRASHPRQPHVVWMVLGLGGFWWMWLQKGYLRFDPEMARLFTLIPLFFIIKVWLAYAGSRFFLSDRQSGAFELLLSTPLEPGDIVKGQFLALRRQFAWPIIVLLVAAWYNVLSSDGDRQFSLLILGWMVSCVLDFFALTWVSMWCGLTGRRLNRIALGVLWRVVMLPCVIWGVLWFILDLSGTDSSGTRSAVLFLVIGYANSVFYIFHSRSQLNKIFGRMATHKIAAHSASA